MADEPSGSQANKRQKVDGQNGDREPILQADYKYDPEDLVDFVIKCSDNKKIACHRVFVLRFSKLFGRLLDDCPTNEVAVTESSQDLRAYLLDIIYDRSTAITANNCLKVFTLADKYEAPSIIKACGALLASFEFTLLDIQLPSVHAPGAMYVIDALGLASKHGFKELHTRCLSKIKESVSTMDSTILTTLANDELMLEVLPSAVLTELLTVVAQGTDKALTDSKTQIIAQKNETAEKQSVIKSLEEKLKRQKKNYTSLLNKYNKLVAKAKHAGLETKQNPQIMI